MPAYFLLIFYYVLLAGGIGVNIFVSRQLREYVYLGSGIRAFSIAYYLLWATILILTHLYIFTHDWTQIITFEALT